MKMLWLLCFQIYLPRSSKVYFKGQFLLYDFLSKWHIMHILEIFSKLPAKDAVMLQKLEESQPGEVHDKKTCLNINSSSSERGWWNNETD